MSVDGSELCSFLGTIVSSYTPLLGDSLIDAEPQGKNTLILGWNILESSSELYDLFVTT